jgi:hypothetical protein
MIDYSVCGEYVGGWNSRGKGKEKIAREERRKQKKGKKEKFKNGGEKGKCSKGELRKLKFE